MRLHYTDPDYRRNPKTERFCALCQRDLKAEAKTIKAILSSAEACCVVHPEDAVEDDIEILVGSECAKKVPPEYRI